MKKVILLSGASGSLGKAVSEYLSSQGHLVYCGARNPDNISISNDNIRPLKLDITLDNDCETAIKRIIADEGRIDVLINNASATVHGPTVEFDSKAFIEILDVNAVGAFRLMKNVHPHMKDQKSGKIINITSLNGLISFPNFGLYNASKFAIEALGTALSYEWQRDGIFVTNIAPGAIKSESKDSNQSLSHKPAREKFLVLRILMPLVSQQKIISKIEAVINSSSPPTQVILGMDAKITTLAKRFMPFWAWDRLLRFVWNKK
jgi:NAD(P)-dependent dehydrogenase (short-subunit alcohol dehydrogenase family)